MAMSKIKNILFIMADQLRWDHLSCYGHRHLQTPNIDKLAKRGLQFNRAFVQSPVCGPSRASTYTGRTAFSHGSTWNTVPLPIGELTLGDYLRPVGVRTAVVGKTHMAADNEGMARLGLTRDSEIGMVISEPGFEPFERDDGLHPTPLLKLKGGNLTYNNWLRNLGYDSENPWNDFANSAEGENGEVLSGWHLRHSNLPARVKEEHSETAYMTMRAREFIEDSGDQPWCLHLSYIKPHWPYIAPAPYHNIYGPESFLPVHRHECERNDPNPVYEAFMGQEVSESFSRQGVRETVMPAYMGLIKEIDDHLGRLFSYLDETGKTEETMIVFTSDHGDYLGDHWLGEKELFHEVSVRVPQIIVDPRPGADKTRGQTTDALVEAIDLVTTFLEAAGAPIPTHRLEGRSLQPIIHGQEPANWREAVFSEIDYAFYGARETLGADVSDCRGYMIRTNQWKYVYFKGFSAQLFDLENDPDEFHDLGRCDKHQTIRAELKDLLFERLIDRKNRVTMSDQQVLDTRNRENKSGILIGKW